MSEILAQLSYLFDRREKRNAGILFAMMLVGSVFEVVGVGAIPAFISVISMPERLLEMPMGKLDFLVGYAIAFGLVAAVQSVLAVAVSVGLLDLEISGPLWLLTIVAVVDAILGSALGLFVSAFAQTEFQAVQFMPALIIPQLLLCGLLVPRDLLPDVLEVVSDVLPLSYAVDAMQHLTTSTSTGQVWQDIAVVAAFAAAGLALVAATLRRRTP